MMPAQLVVEPLISAATPSQFWLFVTGDAFMSQRHDAHGRRRTGPRLFRAASRARLGTMVSRPGGRGRPGNGDRSRKVGAPTVRVLVRARAGQPVGPGNRKQTADGRRLRTDAQARVKRCGKSAPVPGAISAAGNPHSEQGQAWDTGRLSCSFGASQGGPHRWMVTQGDPGDGLLDRTPPTGRLTIIQRSEQPFLNPPNCVHTFCIPSGPALDPGPHQVCVP